MHKLEVKSALQVIEQLAAIKQHVYNWIEIMLADNLKFMQIRSPNLKLVKTPLDINSRSFQRRCFEECNKSLFWLCSTFR